MQHDEMAQFDPILDSNSNFIAATTTTSPILLLSTDTPQPPPSIEMSHPGADTILACSNRPSDYDNSDSSSGYPNTDFDNNNIILNSHNIGSQPFVINETSNSFTPTHIEAPHQITDAEASLTDPFSYTLLDNHNLVDHQSNQSIDSGVSSTKRLYPMDSDALGDSSLSGIDSTVSMDTIYSTTSSSDVNQQMSTVSSSECLLEPSSESEEEEAESQHPAIAATTEATSLAMCNEGYTFNSSFETLDDDDSSIGGGGGYGGQEENNGNEFSEADLMLRDEEEEEDEEEEGESLGVSTTTEGSDAVGQTLSALMHHLLAEDQEVTLTVEEVNPDQLYSGRIANNITVADESFLYNSSLTLGGDSGIGRPRKRRTTMFNIYDRSSFLDLTEIAKVGRMFQRALVYLKDDLTFGSLVSLNTFAAKDIDGEDPTQSFSLIPGDKIDPVLPKQNYMKNLIALSISVTLLFTAMGSVRNLQSSINHEEGVGVMGLAVSYVGFMVGSLFSSSMVQNFQPRKCFIANLFPNLLYVASNLYPAMWVIAPISFIQGVSFAMVCNSISTYITFLAKGCAEKTEQPFSQVSGKYFGTYCLMYQTHIIMGNLIASFVLQPPEDVPGSDRLFSGSMNSNASTFNTSTDIPIPYSSNASMHLQQNVTHPSGLQLCGANFCQHFEIGGSRFSVDIERKFLLFGIYIGCIVISLLTAILFMEPLNPNLFRSTVSAFQTFKSQMSSLARLVINVKFLLLLPLLMYSTMQFGFVSAEFLKGYVTCPLGIHMIGYTMICFGICSSASSYVCGLLNKYLGRKPFIVIAGILNLGSLIYMHQWQPSLGSLIPYFVVMGLWGISDGLWITQVNSLMGVIFPKNYEEAYAGLRMTQGLSVAVTFGYSNALCMTVKIYITAVFCFLGLVGYLVMESKHRCEQNKLADILLKQTSV